MTLLFIVFFSCCACITNTAEIFMPRVLQSLSYDGEAISVINSYRLPITIQFETQLLPDSPTQPTAPKCSWETIEPNDEKELFFYKFVHWTPNKTKILNMVKVNFMWKTPDETKQPLESFTFDPAHAPKLLILLYSAHKNKLIACKAETIALKAEPIDTKTEQICEYTL